MLFQVHMKDSGLLARAKHEVRKYPVLHAIARFFRRNWAPFVFWPVLYFFYVLYTEDPSAKGWKETTALIAWSLFFGWLSIPWRLHAGIRRWASEWGCIIILAIPVLMLLTFMVYRFFSVPGLFAQTVTIIVIGNWIQKMNERK